MGRRRWDDEFPRALATTPAVCRNKGQRYPARAPSPDDRGRRRLRFPPHQLRHGHALEFAREGVALSIIERQLGHATSIYLHGIDTDEIIAAAHNRRGPMISATAGLRH
jgi:integrase